MYRGHTPHTERKLSDWRKEDYANHPSLCSIEHVKENMTRFDADLVTIEEFVSRYERPALPAVFRGGLKGWSADTKWSLENLRRDYGQERFRSDSTWKSSTKLSLPL